MSTVVCKGQLRDSLWKFFLSVTSGIISTAKMQGIHLKLSIEAHGELPKSANPSLQTGSCDVTAFRPNPQLVGDVGDQISTLQYQ